MAASAGAQQTDTVSLTKTVQFAIPETPAFDFIGQSPDEVTRPITAKALAAALLSGVNAKGQFQQGVALEVAPWQLLTPRMDLRAYQSGTGFLFSNLSLSLGSVQSSSDSAATNVGLGLRVVAVDRTDPLGPASKVAGDSAIWTASRTCLPRDAAGNPVPITDANAPAVKACVVTADSAFRASWREQHWNDYALSLAAATGRGLRNSAWSDTYSLGWSAWALGAAPLCFRAGLRGLCGKSQWIVKAQYERRDSVGVATPLTQWTGGLRGTLGSSTFALFVEDLVRRRAGGSGGSESRSDWSTGVEFRATEGTWVSAGIGTRYNELAKDSRAVVLAGLRFNVSPKQLFTEITPKVGAN